jgi:hypothetical protein
MLQWHVEDAARAWTKGHDTCVGKALAQCFATIKAYYEASENAWPDPYSPD